jgi:hypothetical protein
LGAFAAIPQRSKNVMLHHRFTPERAGAQYDSTMSFGMAGMLGRMVNPPLNRWVLDERHAQAWIKHNIEEVGLLEAVLPRVLPNAMATRPEAVAACA